MLKNILKHSGLILGLALLLASSFVSAQDTDTASVKIKVDVESVTILLNDDSLLLDSYGNQLIAGAWFVLNLSSGDYQFSFHHPDYDSQTRQLMLGKDEIGTIEIRFLPEEIAPPEDTTGTTLSSLISIHSTPVEAMITLDGTMLTEETPTEIRLNSGPHQIELLLDGWEPLSHTVEISNSNSIILNYLLMPTAPPQTAPEVLGLEYRQQLMRLDVRTAENLRATFNSLTETFAILPLGQGLVAKGFLRGDQEKTANVLIATGVVLSAGSYILGKILYKNKVNKINSRNEEIEVINLESDEHNEVVDLAIKEHDAESLESWLKENDGKGIVEVEKLSDSLIEAPPQ